MYHASTDYLPYTILFERPSCQCDVHALHSPRYSSHIGSLLSAEHHTLYLMTAHCQNCILFIFIADVQKFLLMQLHTPDSDDAENEVKLHFDKQ